MSNTDRLEWIPEGEALRVLRAYSVGRKRLRRWRTFHGVYVVPAGSVKGIYCRSRIIALATGGK